LAFFLGKSQKSLWQVFKKATVLRGGHGRSRRPSMCCSLHSCGMSAEVISCLFLGVKKALGGMPAYSLEDGVPIKPQAWRTGLAVVGKNRHCLVVQVKNHTCSGSGKTAPVAPGRW